MRRLWILGPLVLSFAAACDPGTAVTYDVSPVSGDPHRLAVTLRLKNTARDSLALRGYASGEVLRLADLEASGPRGERIAAEARAETVLLEGSRVEVPRFILRGPLPPSLTVRYQVLPGRREGDSHMGFTGRCFGYAGSEFALVTGRDLFLLPDPGAEAIRRIAVRFSLPKGWSAIPTWPEERGSSRLENLPGTSAAEEMISGTVGLGQFHERTLRLGGTQFQMAFAS